LHMIIHGFVCLNLQNRLMSIICKLAFPCASLLLRRLSGFLNTTTPNAI